MALISCPTKLRYVPWTLLNVWSQRTRREYPHAVVSTSTSLMQDDYWGKTTQQSLIHSFVSVQKTWQYTSRASTEFGFLFISKEEFHPLVTWQKSGIIRRPANAQTAIYTAQMSFQVIISISKTVFELTYFNALKYWIWKFPLLWSTYFPAFFQSLI